MSPGATYNTHADKQGLPKDLSGIYTEGAQVTSGEMEGAKPTLTRQPTQDAVVDEMAENIGDLRLRRKRLSGAAKKRLRREREAGGGNAPLLTPETRTVGKSKREEETPSSLDKKPKRPRGAGPHGGTRHYAEAAMGLPRLAFLHSCREKEITVEEGGLIEDGIVELMDKLGEVDFIPKFQDTHIYRGTLRVTCPDTQSERWLRENVGRIDKWEGAKLEVVGVHELPKFIKAIAYFPGREKDPKVLLNRLQKQNPGLLTGKWHVYDAPKEHEDATAKSVRLVLGVEDSCLPALENLEMRPYCGMRRATFQVARHGTQGSTKPAEDQPPSKG